MKQEQFNKIISEQMQRSFDVLVMKSDEYASSCDKLHNFKSAGVLQHCSPIIALTGMMAKHTISIYDMCGNVGCGIEEYPIDRWDEKITDNINYLLLLRALIEEK